MAKAVILNKIGDIEYKELRDEYIYKPTTQEEIDHGTKSTPCKMAKLVTMRSKWKLFWVLSAPMRCLFTKAT